jgi:hypothetical protein
VEHNKLQNIPAALGVLGELYTLGNPLLQILPAYRHDSNKVYFLSYLCTFVMFLHFNQLLQYLRLTHGQHMLPWNQVKLMIVGQAVYPFILSSFRPFVLSSFRLFSLSSYRPVNVYLFLFIYLYLW